MNSNKLYKIFIALILITMMPGYVAAETAGPNYAGTATQSATHGSSGLWTHTSQATGNDNTNFALTTFKNPKKTRLLILTGYDFNIPQNATIEGIEVEVEWKSGDFEDVKVMLTEDGSTPTGNNKAKNKKQNTKKFTSYGGNSDNWGAGLTPQQINSEDFGIILQYKKTTHWNSMGAVKVYRAKITVHYTLTENPPETPDPDVTPPQVFIHMNTTTIELGSEAIEIKWLAEDNEELDTTIFNMTAPNGSVLSSSNDANSSIILTPSELTVLGTYTANLWANDTAGNNASTSKTFNVVDTTPPTITLVEPEDNKSVEFANHEFKANFTDVGELQNATLHLWKSNGTQIYESTVLLSGTSDEAMINLSLLEEGTYYWNYEACDISGNCGFAENNNTLIYSEPATPTSSSGGGGASGAAFCTTQWSCSPWSACIGGVQTRVCSYPDNFCPPEEPRPEETQLCAVEPEIEQEEEEELQQQTTPVLEEEEEAEAEENGFVSPLTGQVVGSGQGLVGSNVWWFLAILLLIAVPYGIYFTLKKKL